MPKALYRKYRSKSLDTIIGQPHITEVLSEALKNGNTAHAYLLTGPRGVGKTSIARILAHEINQLPYVDDAPHMDIIEIDAASNNGVDSIRDLREKALIAPALAPKKIYIIDEVHMLSKPAFNALLKILEEPPEHIVFIMATTDFDKIPPTIVSRTQRFNFHFVPQSVIAEHLLTIADHEAIKLDNDAALLIAEQGEGSVRDSVSLLDQLRAGATHISVNTVEQNLGLVAAAKLINLADVVKKRQAVAIIQQLDALIKEGISPATIARQLATTLRSELASYPYLAPTIEALLEVGRARHPDIKLLVILLEGSDSATLPPKPKSHTSAAAMASRPTIELTPPTVPKRTASKPQKSVAPSTNQPAESEPDTPSEPLSTSKNTATTPLTEDMFDWQKLLDHAKTKDGVIAGMLQKCSPEVINGKLVLYTGKKFHKDRLDDPKHRIKVSTFLQELGIGDILIETVGTPPPPRDAALAKVAELMGGGEEIDV